MKLTTLKLLTSIVFCISSLSASAEGMKCFTTDYQDLGIIRVVKEGFNPTRKIVSVTMNDVFSGKVNNSQSYVSRISYNAHPMTVDGVSTLSLGEVDEDGDYPAKVEVRIEHGTNQTLGSLCFIWKNDVECKEEIGLREVNCIAQTSNRVLKQESKASGNRIMSALLEKNLTKELCLKGDNGRAYPYPTKVSIKKNILTLEIRDPRSFEWHTYTSNIGNRNSCILGCNFVVKRQSQNTYYTESWVPTLYYITLYPESSSSSFKLKLSETQYSPNPLVFVPKQENIESCSINPDGTERPVEYNTIPNQSLIKSQF